MEKVSSIKSELLEMEYPRRCKETTVHLASIKIGSHFFLYFLVYFQFHSLLDADIDFIVLKSYTTYNVTAVHDHTPNQF